MHAVVLQIRKDRRGEGRDRASCIAKALMNCDDDDDGECFFPLLLKNTVSLFSMPLHHQPVLPAS